MTDLTDRYATSMYVDLRLGIGGDKIHTSDEAYFKVEKVYGKDAATYAARQAN
jgi:hypothetical protein